MLLACVVLQDPRMSHTAHKDVILTPYLSHVESCEILLFQHLYAPT